MAQQQHAQAGLEILNRFREEINLDEANDDALNNNDDHIAGVDDEEDDNDNAFLFIN
jgi:hypothetical protein